MVIIGTFDASYKLKFVLYGAVFEKELSRLNAKGPDFTKI